MKMLLQSMKRVEESHGEHSNGEGRHMARGPW